MSGPYNPSLEEVERLADQGNMVPVYREVSADLETPVSAYIKVARPPYSFLLESVEGGEQIARYSFIGTEPLGVVRTGAGQTNGMVDPLIPIQRTMNAYKLVPIPDLGPFNGGMVGYISYDAVKYFERLPTPENDPVDVPESVFMMTTTFLIFDHVRHVIRVVSHAFLDGDVETAYNEAIERIDEIVGRLDAPLQVPARSTNGTAGSEVTSNLTRQDYDHIVERCKEYIYDGDIIQTVPSQRFSRSTTAHPLAIYRALRAINPSPYMYYLELDDFHIVGASPEELVRVQDGVVSTRPIAGTMPRGKTKEQDDETERHLLARREGAGRAHHAGRPRTQRRGPRMQARQRRGYGADDRRAVLPRHAHRLLRRGRPPRRQDGIRCAPLLLPRRNIVRRSEDPGQWRSSPRWSRIGADRTAAPSATST